jgi:RND family efflux transporter MFP subunit
MRRAAIASQWPIVLSVLAALVPWSATPAADAPAAGLATFRVESAPVPEERLLDGTVEAVNQSTVSAQTAGRIDAIHFDVNDHVEAGTVILRIRSTEQVAGLTQAQAALKEATARESEAQVRYQRINDMYQRRVVAKATLDEASAARDAAVARLIAARAGLDAAREGVAYTEVRAPYSGVVTQKFVQLGEMVTPGTPLMAGASLDALRVVAEVPQSVIEQVRKVHQAVVYVDGKRVESTGLTLFPSAEPQTNTFRVRIELPRRVQGLAPGMFVKVGLVTGATDLLLVPRAAIVERSEMRAVYVVAPDGRVSLRQVRLGHVRGDQIEILAGLIAGDTIARDPAAAAARAYRQGVKRD